MDKRESILKENLWKLVYRLSLPGILGMLIISANTLFDAIFVGRLIGPQALAGVSLLIPAMVINTALINLVAAGGASVLSRAIGAGRVNVLQHIFWQVFFLALIIALLLTIAGRFFSIPIISLTSGDATINPYAADWYTTYMQGCVFSVVGLCLSALIRGEGQIKYAMYITGICMLLNIILNPVFIIAGKAGVKGSAYATMVAMAVYCVLTLIYFFSGRSAIRTAIRDFKWQWTLVRDILSVGVSAMLMQLNSFVRQLFLFRTLSYYGTGDQLVVFVAIYRFFSFAIIPVFGVLQAMQPLVGINYGAGNIERSFKAVKVSRMAAIGFMFCVALLAAIFSQSLLRIFLPDFYLTAGDLMHFRLILCVLVVAPIASTGVVFLQATGNARMALYLSGGRELGLFIPMILFIPSFYGVEGIYFTLFSETILYVMIVLLIVKLKMNHIKSLQPVIS